MKGQLCFLLFLNDYQPHSLTHGKNSAYTCYGLTQVFTEEKFLLRWLGLWGQLLSFLSFNSVEENSFKSMGNYHNIRIFSDF